MDASATRRSVIGAFGWAAWPGLMPAVADAASTVPDASIPEAAVPKVEFAFSAHVLLEPTIEIGRTPYGIRRRIPIIGGTLEGPRLRGRITPGGADWQLQRADNYTVLEADYMIETDDGTAIHVHNRGLTNTRVKGATTRYLRTIPEFEAPQGRHEWLNQSVFVGSLQGVDKGPPSVVVHVFRLV